MKCIFISLTVETVTVLFVKRGLLKHVLKTYTYIIHLCFKHSVTILRRPELLGKMSLGNVRMDQSVFLKHIVKQYSGQIYIKNVLQYTTVFPHRYTKYSLAVHEYVKCLLRAVLEETKASLPIGATFSKPTVYLH